MQDHKIGIIGLWHLGCVLCASWTKLGFNVIGFDRSETIIKNLKNSEPPIYEPALQEILFSSQKKKVLHFTNKMNELNACDIVFLSLDTPVLENDGSDLSPLQNAIEELKYIIKDGSIIVISSQTPVGTSLKFRNIIQSTKPDVELVYSPENLRLGEAIKCYLDPGRIIIGAETETALSRAIPIFQRISAEIITMNLASAEMVKHGINSFLANSIVFSNHLADLCEISDANIFEVVRGMKSDQRIGLKSYLSPGIGFSGGTLGRDLQVLSKKNQMAGQDAFLFETIHKFNLNRKNTIANKIQKILNGNISDKTISILGLTYKPGTSTLRRSLPLEIVEILIKKGAKIKVYDPKANYDELSEKPVFQVCSSIDDALFESNLVVLLTEWAEFKMYDWEKGLDLVKEKKLFDTKNFLYDLTLKKYGCSYFGIGFRNP